MNNVIDFEKYRKNKETKAIKTNLSDTNLSPEMMTRLQNIKDSIQRINKLMEDLRANNSR
jgi:hypothetical protein